MFSRQVERMIDSLAKCTYNNTGCKQYGTYCEKGYNGILAKLKTPEECRECIVNYLKGEKQ